MDNTETVQQNDEDDLIDLGIQSEKAVEEAISTQDSEEVARMRKSAVENSKNNILSTCRSIESRAKESYRNLKNAMSGKSTRANIVSVHKTGSSEIELIFEVDSTRHSTRFDMPTDSKDFEDNQYPVIRLVNYLGLSMNEIKKLEYCDVPVVDVGNSYEICIPKLDGVGSLFMFNCMLFFYQYEMGSFTEQGFNVKPIAGTIFITVAIIVGGLNFLAISISATIGFLYLIGWVSLLLGWAKVHEEISNNSDEIAWRL